MSSRGDSSVIPEPEFEAARSAVEDYFGDLVAEVALEAPVSRARLVSALAKLQVAAERREGLLVESPVVHTGATERVFQLPVERWRTLEYSKELSALEAVAARAVHRRLAAAIHADRRRPRTDPFVLVEPSTVPSLDPR